MFEINGKYTSAKVFTDIVDSGAIGHIQALCNQPCMDGNKVRIMPDCHDGKGCVIGTTFNLSTDKVIPNVVGVDISCGMHVVKLKEKRVELPKLDSIIRKNVPLGMEAREKEHKFVNDLRLEELRCVGSINLDRAYKSLGTLGGGNHFLELNRSELDGSLYLVIHSGSRYLGKQVAEYYQDRAYKKLTQIDRKSIIDSKINELKLQGRENEIEEMLKILKVSLPSISYDLAYCDGDLFNDYMHDIEIVSEYADLNREAMANVILKEMHLHEVESFTTVHNYIDVKNRIVRKGAVSAQLNEKLIIPINMRDGSLICLGKGNDDYNFSAPHGAGRLMSRSEAKNTLSVSEYKKQMKEAGIYSTSVNSSTIDEAPDAYKPIESIIENIQETVIVLEQIKPIYNLKSGTVD